MLVRDITTHIDTLAPPALAEPWDRVGLQIGSLEAETTGCLLALDVTLETIREARRAGVSLVVAHHPVIFEPLSAVTEQSAPGSIILAAARVNVSVYVAHTNLDSSPGVGTGVALAEALGLSRGPALVPALGGNSGGDGEILPVAGMGMVTDVPEITLAGLAQYVAGRLGRRSLPYVGDGARTVRRVALVPGAGGSLVREAAAVADVMVTGEIKYHDAQAAQELGLAVLAAGHYDTERPVLNALARSLKDAFGDSFTLAITQDTPNPFREWLPDGV